MQRETHKIVTGTEIVPVIEGGEGRDAKVSSASLLEQLVSGRGQAALVFAGQGFDCLGELGALVEEWECARAWVQAATDRWVELVGEQRFRWSGLYDQGVDVARWTREPETAPSGAYLTSSAIAQPLIFINQVARYLALYEEGLDRAFESGAIKALTGHSQGMMTACLVAESATGRVATARALEYLSVFAWQGLEMRESFEAGAFAGDVEAWTPMAAVSGVGSTQLETLVQEVNATLPCDEHVFVTLYNTRTRHVVSGPRSGLAALKVRMEREAGVEAKAKAAGRLGGAALSFSFELVPTDAAFHSPYMQRGLEGTRAAVAAMGFQIQPLAIDVLSCHAGHRLNVVEDMIEEVIVGMHIQPVRWPLTLSRLAEYERLTHVLDLGPGDGVARLTRSALKGSGLEVLALSAPAGRVALLSRSKERAPAAPRYSDFAPRLIDLGEGELALDNRFSRATGFSPMILPGMTPTTVDVDMVAAAANGGYCAELAGGGQVTEAIFWSRMDELVQHLTPGQEVVFNALYLDPYLWNLHLGKRKLVQEARRKGYPLCGVTISAGVPEVSEAVALLDELAACGLWLNAFKPGTMAQVKQVIKIARAAPHHQIYVHLEGGKAGGHHSWEDLDQLLLESCFDIRRHPNLILCVGGGVGTEARAMELLTGRWALAYDQPLMPVDAVFLGTVTMACAEATTSPQVKEALAEAAGTGRWVFSGKVEGGVTSGRSQLNADIHYLENAAARCGRLLDAVAGDAEAVAERRDEIIEALDATARPYFGDLAAMSYRQVLDRLVQLMATGRGGRYEDGRWMDVTWRGRFFDFFRRAEARLTHIDAGTFHSVLEGLDDVDDPSSALARFEARYLSRQHALLHPVDVAFFVYGVCARPGKPVPFVPVIDADVRRWYKADSLSAAHDDRYEADQVLVIPGPEAVGGIRRANEPVASLLGRFEAAVVEELVRTRVAPRPAAGRRGPIHAPELPVGVEIEVGAKYTTLRASRAATPSAWFDFIARQLDGPLAQLMVAQGVHMDRRVVPNPVRQLCQATAGSVFRIDNDMKGRVLALFYRPQQAEPVERVEVRVEEGRVHIEVAPSADAPALSMTLTARSCAGMWSFHMDEEGYRRALTHFYHRTMFGAQLNKVERFEVARSRACVPADRARGYARVTRRRIERGVIAPNMLFSLVWEPLFAVLSDDSIASGLLALVHLSNDIDLGEGWPAAPDEALEADARLVSTQNSASGQTLTTESRIWRGDKRVATVTSQFFIRGQLGAFDIDSRVEVERRLRLSGMADATFFAERDWVELDGVTAESLVDASVELELVLTTQREAGGGDFRFGASGTIHRGGALVGRVELDASATSSRHPVLAALDALDAPVDDLAATPRLTLATELDKTPADMSAFAEVSGDMNPIHRSVLMARMARLDAPIVHGMWMAARLEAFVATRLAGSAVTSVERLSASFLDMAPMGAQIRMEAVRTGVRKGAWVVESTMFLVEAQGDRPVCRVTAELAAPRTAYIFPGQGIQKEGMGMASYARSKAARQVWDQADVFTRDRLGFSILAIVRENPREMMVNHVMHRHPQGVLHLTQFTQVAMATLALASVAELRESGVFVEDSIACGHSIGEYNALSAITGTFPLEVVVEIVYQRGCAMHSIVARDSDGESGFRMGVVRPHYAGLSHEGAEALVREVVEKTGAFVQIVNYNVDGRSYSVTGTLAGIEALREALEARSRPGGKPAWVEVPGIDVPFHSDILREGVDGFRQTLEAIFPTDMDPAQLVGRYIPNLVAEVFSLERRFVEVVLEASGSPIIASVLEDFEGWSARPQALTRTLLVELLAYQFASPVRWIETQALLLRDAAAGGLGLDRLIEVGVGYQPTLANMARYSMQLIEGEGPVILNVEAEAEAVLFSDTDPEPETVEEAEEVTEEVAPASLAAPAASVPVATSGAAAVTDQPLSVAEALDSLLALQARVRVEQLSSGESIEELFDGVSSRRNQVLMDLGAEFNLGTIDGAHEKPISALVGEVQLRARGYKGPGAYLKVAQDEALRKVFGRAGVKTSDVTAYLESSWGMGPGWAAAILLELALETRDGESARGGAIGKVGEVTSKAALLDAVDGVVTGVAARRGVSVGKRVAAGATGGAVDSAALDALKDRLIGADGVLTRMARGLSDDLGIAAAPTAVVEPDGRLDTVLAEYGSKHIDRISPIFDPLKHVAFTSSWAFARTRVADLYFEVLNGRMTTETCAAAASRLLPFAESPSVVATSRWYAQKASELGYDDVAAIFEALADGTLLPTEAIAPTRPSLTLGADGSMRYEEVEAPGGAGAFLQSAFTGAGALSAGSSATTTDLWRATLTSALAEPTDFSGATALVTGASPGSIAVEIVRHLLRGGARVIATTTSYHQERLAYYRGLYQDCAAPGAELHIVPFNQGSMQDVEALVDWVFGSVTEQNGPSVRVIKERFSVDVLVPFGAVKDAGTLDTMDGTSEVALRAMLTGVERLIAATANVFQRSGVPSKRCHVLLPLSPNHGDFGGDGAYAEGKAAIEVLLNKWRSEQHTWGRTTSLCAARIGWVRGTGLMDQNNVVAQALEDETGVRTFSASEMGFLLANLAADPMRELATDAPLEVDLTGGFAALASVRETVEGIRSRLTETASYRQRLASLRGVAGAEASHEASPVDVVKALPFLGFEERVTREIDWAPSTARLEDTIVVVGLGELGPWGSARTRFEVEVEGKLSPAGVLELAWTTGLVSFEADGAAGVWIDAETGESVEEADLFERYHDAVLERSGIRWFDAEVGGFDPEQIDVMALVYLERDFTFSVSTEAEAASFLRANPDKTKVTFDPEEGTWEIRRLAGTPIRVPRSTRLKRQVAGLLPTGFDLARYGIPADMVASVDRVALLNLIATVDAYMSAGITPEEILRHIHPARVANTQGGGIGGMRSIQRLYTDALLDAPVQSDVLQETLINVTAAYVVQSYIGSYGPMSHPVGACATAAVSLEEGVDKLMVGKADFVVAGGYDDIGPEGMAGFEGMSATADTDAMTQMGIAPGQMSRANDKRRRGFVESQGGGTVLLTRGDVALELGLPVQGVVAYVSSFGDGIHKSIPAPGLGVLAAACGGARSPLAKALGRYGLTADDVAVVYKHDTSTSANDPNENELHHRIQCALGRTEGNPLFVVSQKTLTGHAKGGSAAWQLNGLVQSLEHGVVAPNRNLDCVDDAMQAFGHMTFTNTTLRPGPAAPLRAGLLTSLGFGHVSALALVLHRDAFLGLMDDDTRRDYLERAAARIDEGQRRFARVMLGQEKAFVKRQDRRFDAPDGSTLQREREAAMLLDAEARIDVQPPRG